MNQAAITEQQPLSRTDLQTIDAYWRAANYLSVGQIYLMGNPLLTRPLQPEDVKPTAARPLGHDPRAEPALRAPEPGDQGLGPGHDLPRRPRARRPGRGGQRVA